MRARRRRVDSRAEARSSPLDSSVPAPWEATNPSSPASGLRSPCTRCAVIARSRPCGRPGPVRGWPARVPPPSLQEAVGVRQAPERPRERAGDDQPPGEQGDARLLRDAPVDPGELLRHRTAVDPVLHDLEAHRVAGADERHVGLEERSGHAVRAVEKELPQGNAGWKRTTGRPAASCATSPAGSAGLAHRGRNGIDEGPALLEHADRHHAAQLRSGSSATSSGTSSTGARTPRPSPQPRPAAWRPPPAAHRPRARGPGGAPGVPRTRPPASPRRQTHRG